MKNIFRFFVLIFTIISTVFLFNNSFAEETLTPYKAPDIKNDFCGTAYMNYKYCKCAFHGNYCDDIGMESGSANSYVQGKFTEYSNKLIKEFADACNSESNAFRSTSKSGCVRCFDPDYKVGTSCKNIEDLCSSDLLVMRDTEKKACYCPEGYKWDTREEICEEMPDVILNTEIDGRLPIQGDGNSKISIKMSMQDTTTEAYKDLEFDLKNSTLGVNNGKISVTGDKNEYIVEYTAPDIIKLNIEKGSDYLYMFYIGKDDERKYKTLEIPVISGTPIVIEKDGFKAKEDVAIFTADTARIKVVTELNGEKIIVNDALVKIKDSEIFSSNTNEEGVAELSSPKSVDGTNVSEIEVVIELNDEILKSQKEASKYYSSIGTGEIKLSDETINDFIQNIAKYLASGDETETKKYISGLKRISYSLFFIDSGKELANESTTEIGKSINGQITGIIDLIDPIGKLTEKIEEKVGAKFENSSKIKEVKVKLQAFAGKYITKLTGMLGQAIKTYAPSLDADAVSGMFSSILGVDDFKEDLIKKPIDDKVKDITNVEKKIKDYFLEKYKKEMQTMLTKIASQIKSNSFDSSITTEQLQSARENYLNVSSQYLKTSDIEYNNTMSKLYIQFGFDTIGEAITYTTAYGKLVEGAQKAFDIAKVAFFDSSTTYTRFETYGTALNDIKSSVNKSLGLAMLGKDDYYVNNFDFSIIETTFAEEITEDIDSVITYLKASGGLDIFNDLKEIGDLLIEIDPENEELITIVNSLDQKIQEVNQELEVLSPEIKEKVKEIEGCYSENDINCDGKVTLVDFTTGELIVLIIILLLFGGGVYFVIKKVRGKK